MVSTSILVALVASAVLSVVWPVAIFVICRRRMTLSVRNILVGAGVFFVFSQVLEKAMHLYLLKLNPATAAWLQSSAFIYALYGCLAAGLFEEVGRYLGMRLLVRPTGNPGTAVAYGIGHGGLESIFIGGLAMVNTFAHAVMLNSGRFDTTLGPSIPPAVLAQMRSSLEHLTMTPLVLGSLERLVALLVQIGFSLVVWRAVEQRRLAWLALAIALHAAVDFPAGLFQKGQMSPIVTEAIFYLPIGAALIVLYLRFLPSKVGATAAPQG